MNRDNDPNSYIKSVIEESKRTGRKPSLFLHACCGPCLTYPFSFLAEYFDLTVGFFNPNIYPLEEHERRLVTMESFLQRYMKDCGFNARFVVLDDDFEAYEKALVSRKDDREGGQACLLCHAYRLYLGYKYADDHHFDYYTTVMTVSSRKPSKELNEIALRLSSRFSGTKYLFSDFKKEDGQLKGIRISKEYSLYRQDYCGCKYSLRERDERKLTRQAS